MTGRDPAGGLTRAAGRLTRAVQFGAVSAGSIVFTQLVLAGLQLVGLSAVLANALAVSLAAILTYLASCRWVWRHSRQTGRTREMVLFGLTAAVGFGLSTGLVWLLVSPGAPVLHANLVNIAAFAAVWIGKYLVLDTVVFAPHAGTERWRLSKWERGSRWSPEDGWHPNGARRQPSWLSQVLHDTSRAAGSWAPVAVAVAALLLVPVVTLSALASVEAPDVPRATHPGRPGATEGDREADLGDSITVDGIVTTVQRGKLIRDISPLENGRYLRVTVRVDNTSDTVTTVRRNEWRVRTPAGHVYEAAVTTTHDLADRRIMPRRGVQGRLLFEVGREEGTFYVQHTPGGRRNDRGIWRVVAER